VEPSAHVAACASIADLHGALAHVARGEMVRPLQQHGTRVGLGQHRLREQHRLGERAYALHRTGRPQRTQKAPCLAPPCLPLDCTTPLHCAAARATGRAGCSPVDARMRQWHARTTRGAACRCARAAPSQLHTDARSAAPIRHAAASPGRELRSDASADAGLAWMQWVCMPRGGERGKANRKAGGWRLCETARSARQRASRPRGS
jgi:hypothetical protein